MPDYLILRHSWKFAIHVTVQVFNRFNSSLKFQPSSAYFITTTDNPYKTRANTRTVHTNASLTTP